MFGFDIHSEVVDAVVDDDGRGKGQESTRPVPCNSGPRRFVWAELVVIVHGLLLFINAVTFPPLCLSRSQEVDQGLPCTYHLPGNLPGKIPRAII